MADQDEPDLEWLEIHRKARALGYRFVGLGDDMRRRPGVTEEMVRKYVDKMDPIPVIVMPPPPDTDSVDH